MSEMEPSAGSMASKNHSQKMLNRHLKAYNSILILSITWFYSVELYSILSCLVVLIQNQERTACPPRLVATMGGPRSETIKDINEKSGNTGPWIQVTTKA